MSFTSKYESVNIAAEDGKVREALTARAESHGWEVIDNKARVDQGLQPEMVRAHGAENRNIYDLIIKSPSKEYNAYDIGANITTVRGKDGKESETSEITYDSYQGHVEKEWGKNCIQLKKEVIIEAVRLGHNETVRGMYDFESFIEQYVTGPDGKKMSKDELKDQENLLLHTMDDPIAQADY